MNQTNIITPDEIIQAVNERKKNKPDFAPMLDIYGMIFTAQENAKKNTTIDSFTIPDDILKIKLGEQLPLVEISQFMTDADASVRLFNEICGILSGAGDELSGQIKIIASSAVSSLNEIFSAFLKGDEPFFDILAESSGFDKKILGFIVYNSLKPSLELFSRMVAAIPKCERFWTRGCCPVCGSMPGLSMFGENGKRSLSCGFCSHEWDSKRMFCPYCENTDHEALHYYDIDGEEEYRVDLCDKCKSFIKTIDLRKTSRPIYLPLEVHSTPYIDQRFREMGYKPGNA